MSTLKNSVDAAWLSLTTSETSNTDFNVYESLNTLAESVVRGILRDQEPPVFLWIQPATSIASQSQDTSISSFDSSNLNKEHLLPFSKCWLIGLSGSFGMNAHIMHVYVDTGRLLCSREIHASSIEAQSEILASRLVLKLDWGCLKRRSFEKLSLAQNKYT